MHQNTVRALMRALSTAYEWGRGKEWNPHNPVKAAGIPSEVKSTKKRIFFLHPRYDVQILGVIEVWAKAAYLLGVDLGLRIGTIIQLKTEYFFLNARPYLHVPGEILKQKREGVRDPLNLPLPQRIIPFLTEQIERARLLRSPWLFPSPRSSLKHVSAEKLRETFQEATAACGIDGSWFHDLRHTANTRIQAACRAAGDSRNDAQETAMGILGHESKGVNDGYSHLEADADILRPAIEKLDRWAAEVLDASAASAPEVAKAA